MPLHDRLILLVAVATLGCGFFLYFDLSYSWLVLLGAIMCVGADGLVRSHPILGRYDATVRAGYWVLPVAATVAAALFLREIASGYGLAIGLALTAFGLLAVLLAQVHSVHISDPLYHLSHMVLNVASYITAFIAFAALYELELRTAFAVLFVGVVGAVLALQLFRQATLSWARPVLYALVTGVLLGQTQWALDYWSMRAYGTAIFLLLIFYFITGVSQSYISRRLTGAMLLEFAGVTLVGFAFLYGLQAWPD